MLIAALMAER